MNTKITKSDSLLSAMFTEMAASNEFIVAKVSVNNAV